jgi:hypothetical protein
MPPLLPRSPKNTGDLGGVYGVAWCVIVEYGKPLMQSTGFLLGLRHVVQVNRLMKQW